jgi:hypothetical protein
VHQIVWDSYEAAVPPHIGCPAGPNANFDPRCLIVGLAPGKAIHKWE